MTDRELLERAARAAWLDVEWTAGEPFLGEQIWNPFKSDADAFRLMVALRLCVSYSDPEEGPDFVGVYQDWGGHLARESGSGAQITRLAIVRAAAEMGDGQ